MQIDPPLLPLPSSSSSSAAASVAKEREEGERRQGPPPRQVAEVLLDEPPEFLVCPITFELFRDPVLNKYGSMFERAAIVDHLKRHQSDPLTGQSLTLQDELYPSRATQHMCEEWRKEHPNYRQN